MAFLQYVFFDAPNPLVLLLMRKYFEIALLRECLIASVKVTFKRSYALVTCNVCFEMIRLNESGRTAGILTNILSDFYGFRRFLLILSLLKIPRLTSSLW